MFLLKPFKSILYNTCNNEVTLNKNILKMKQELLNRLDELRNLAKEAMEVQMGGPKMSHKYYMSTILELDCNSRDKVILMDMYIHDGSVKGSEAQARCNMTKTEYNNGARSLVKHGYTVKNSYGSYSINMNIY